MSSASAEPPRRRTRLSAADRQETRDLLIQAAIRTFAIRGYVNSSVSDIVAEAGASRATFYLHFGAKPDVLDDLIARAGTEFTQPYDDLIPILQSHDWGGFDAWIFESMHRWARIKDLMRPVFEAADTDGELYRRLFPEDVPGLSPMTRTLLESGYVDGAEQAELYATILYAPLLQVFRQYLRGDEVNFELIAETLAAVWADVLQGAMKRSRPLE